MDVVAQDPMESRNELGPRTMESRNEQPCFQASHQLIYTQRPLDGACGGTPNTFRLSTVDLCSLSVTDKGYRRMRGLPLAVSRPPVTLFAEAILWRIQKEDYERSGTGTRRNEERKREREKERRKTRKDKGFFFLYRKRGSGGRGRRKNDRATATR